MSPTTPLAGRSVVGTVELVSLASVQPNAWNPNEMTKEVFASLKHGLSHDGWLSSQALLVWRADEYGVARNLIIDGEHRWRVAKQLGFADVPVVFLDGISEAKAKSLTIAMNQRRGDFDDAALGALLREIQYDLATEDDTALSVQLGFDEERVMSLLAETAEELPPAPPNKHPPAPKPPAGAEPALSDVRLVQLFLTDDQRALYDTAIAALASTWGIPADAHTARNVVSEAAHRAPDPTTK